MHLLALWPDRPPPLAYPAIALPVAVATPLIGGGLMDDRPSSAALAGAGLLGGATIGTAMAVLEAAIPSPSGLTGIGRWSLNLALAAPVGAALGAELLGRAGGELVRLDEAAQASVLGTSIIIIAGLGAAMGAVLLGVLRPDADP